MGVAMEHLGCLLLCLVPVLAQEYGPVSLDSVDALTLNWNQIHWLVKDQIKEVEELREEHNELYNEITRCFGNERCLEEFGLLDLGHGSKLHGLGLRALDLSSSAMTRMRDEVLKTKARLDMEMRQRWSMDRRIAEEQANLAQQEKALAQAEAQRHAQTSSPSSRGSSSSSSSSSSWSSSSSSYSRGSSSGHAQGQSFFGQSPQVKSQGSSFFSNVNTTFGQRPEVYERRYQYSSGSGARAGWQG